MTPTIKGAPQHTGAERYEVTLAYGEDELRRIDRLTEPGDVLVEEVVLVWERPAGQKWQRVVAFKNGSRGVGAIKKYDGSRWRPAHKEIFDRRESTLLPWTARLPGLRNKIEELEDELPFHSYNRV